MTRKEFEAKAIREAEKALGVPAGWWGTWRDVRGPRGVRVRYSGRFTWTLSQRGKRISKHDSRSFAITKARKLVR